jgi:hypothetical protein
MFSRAIPPDPRVRPAWSSAQPGIRFLSAFGPLATFLECPRTGYRKRFRPDHRNQVAIQRTKESP